MSVFLPLLPLYRGFLYGGVTPIPLLYTGAYMAIQGGYIWGYILGLVLAFVLVHWVLVFPLLLLCVCVPVGHC